MILFTREVYLRLFDQYNAAVWPAQLVAYLAAAVVLLMIFRRRRGGRRIIAAILAGFWAWAGVIYHMGTFATINWAAWGFGVLFVVQSAMLAWTGGVRGRLSFRLDRTPTGWTGMGLMALALAAYPLIGPLTGAGWTQVGLVGVAPNPTVLFTLAVLLLARGGVPVALLVIPLVWCLIVGLAAWFVPVPEDVVLIPAGVLALVLAVRRRRRVRRVRPAEPRPASPPPPGSPGCGTGGR